jgi:toxin ParE1/3/4
MPAITLTVTARQDLLGIWEYIATDNVAAADRVLDTLDARMQLLADHPLLGPARPDIAPDFRYLVSGNYLILHHILPDASEIVRVLHGARNLTAIFTDIDPLH